MIAVVLAAALAAGPSPAEDLYPIAVGARWVYQQQVIDGSRPVAQDRIVRKVTRKVRLPLPGRPLAFEIVTQGNLARLPRWAQRAVEYAVLGDQVVQLYVVNGPQRVPVLERVLPRLAPRGGLFIVGNAPVQTVTRAQVMLRPYRGPGVTLERRGCNLPGCEVSDVTLAPGIGEVGFVSSGGAGISPTLSFRSELVDLQWPKRRRR